MQIYKKTMVIILSLLLFIGSANCISIASTFNHKSNIHSNKTRKTINTIAFYGYMAVFLPISLYGLSIIMKDVEIHGESSSFFGYVATIGAIIIAVPFVVSDLLVAKLIHKILYDDDYEFELK